MSVVVGVARHRFSERPGMAGKPDARQSTRGPQPPGDM
jgi:hypothetical protein